MYRILKRVIWLVLVSLSSCTDLAAVYRGDILLLRDADKITPETPLPWDHLILPLPEALSYPVGLTYDPEVNRLFVADARSYSKLIYSIYLSSDYKVEAMQTAVTSSEPTVLDSLIYDPRSGQLYWTDSENHGVFKAQVSSKLEGDIPAEPVLVHNYGDVIEPRGIAIDYCNEQLYWSERGKETLSSVEKCNLDGSEHQIVLQEANVTYQGMTYDMMKKTLIWAEFREEGNKSYCRILSGPMEHQVLVDLENCLPFSVITDKEYIYWADLDQQGIMRASLTNLGDIVKLVHTPDVESDLGMHLGVYGLTMLSGPTKDSILSICKGKTDVMKKVNMNDPELEEKIITTEPSKLGLATEEMSENEHSSGSATEKTAEVVSNHIANKSRSVVAGSETEAPPYTSLVTQEDKLMVGGEMCNADRLLLIITVLAVICTLLMSSTIFLMVKLSCQRNTRECKTAQPIIATSKEAVLSRPTRQVKRFGPKKRYGSGNKSGFNGTSPCSGLSGGDGVSINIEDCCQMTMCETPCFTSVKREGKGYKNSDKITSKHEDKIGLLDDREDI